MHKLLITVSMLLITVIFPTVAIVAQDRDPIDLARVYPPTLLGETETALAQIEWRLRHLKQTREKQTEEFKPLMERLAHSKEEAKRLTETLPIELRFANQDVRAELIGACLKELLSARLEVASNEEIISRLSQELEKAKLERARIDRLQKEKHELQIKALEKKVGLTANEYQQNKRFSERGSKTKQELERSKYSMQISEYELAQAKLEMEIESESRANEIAQRLVAARIETQPIKARAAAAEKFLKLFSDSNDTINKIEELNSVYEAGAEYSEEFTRRRWASYDQIAELESLKEMIQSAAQKADANTDLEEKEESDEE